jgi:Flp pilus assembly protein TadD
MAAPGALQRGFERFWTDFWVSDAKLRTFRFLFFGLLAVDCFHQLAHAYRYGLHDFNVSHLSFLDGVLPMPHRVAMLVLYLTQAYLAARIALGGVSRATYGVLAGLFSLGYFISQLNSYQHHYLLCIATALCAFFPWPDLRHSDDRRQYWTVRMLMVALAIMYFYATITKLNPQWLDGSTLDKQMRSADDWLRNHFESIGFSTLALLTVFAEATLVGSILIRKLWPVAVVVGVPMHIVFEMSGLKIGLFSFFMVTVYSLFIPDRVYEIAAGWLHKLRPQLAAPAWLKKLTLPALLVSLVLGAVMLMALPFGVFLLSTLFITAAAAIDLADRKSVGRTAISHLVAIAALLVLLHTTDAARDYFRFWGGALRRQGDFLGATAAYQKVVEIAPDYSSGHRHLGDLYLRSGEEEKALDEYRNAVLLDETNWKGYLGLARAFHALQRGTLALQSAEEVLRIKPREPTARRIRDYWHQRGLQ